MLPYPLPGPFDYQVPPGLDPQPGDVVLVKASRAAHLEGVAEVLRAGGDDPPSSPRRRLELSLIHI